MDIMQTHSTFMPDNSPKYPPHHEGHLIEQYAYQFFYYTPVKTNRMYLPIYWTNYWIARMCPSGYRPDAGAQAYVQQIIDTNPGRRFMTISQLDDGIRVNFPECLKFSSGGIGDIPIPLLCSPHRTTLKPRPKYLASFAGSIWGRHRTREKMYNAVCGKPGIFLNPQGGDPGRSAFFADIMSDSVFSLCPRGYGKTSFRICEAVHIGSIPVYIYDDPWMPFKDRIDWNSFCVLVPENEISSLYDRLASISQDKIRDMRNNLINIKRYFTMQGCCETIKDILEKLND